MGKSNGNHQSKAEIVQYASMSENEVLLQAAMFLVEDFLY